MRSAQVAVMAVALGAQTGCGGAPAARGVQRSSAVAGADATPGAFAFDWGAPFAAYADDREVVADRAKIRVIHLSPDAPAVDVVALGTGGAIAARLVTNLAFPNATPTSLLVTPGTYTLAVVPTGQSAPVLPTAAGATVTLTAGQVLTVAAVGCLNTTSGTCAGGQPFGFQVLTDN